MEARPTPFTIDVTAKCYHCRKEVRASVDNIRDNDSKVNLHHWYHVKTGEERC